MRFSVVDALSVDNSISIYGRLRDILCLSDLFWDGVHPSGRKRRKRSKDTMYCFFWDTIQKEKLQKVLVDYTVMDWHSGCQLS